MKNSILIFLSLISLSCYSQEVASFGKEISEEGAIHSADLVDAMRDRESLAIKVKGIVNEVCQAKGCWLTMDLDQDQVMRVTFKDYGFFVPVNSSGKNVTIEGTVQKQTVTVDMLKHYAKDAGKSDQEISSINESEISYIFVADGVLIAN